MYGTRRPAVDVVEEELHELDRQLKQLKLDYEQYFLGNRPREPRPLRDDLYKQVQRLLGIPIRNTALRFRFNSTNARFQALRRQWDNTLRQIECGTYERHVFKANLRERKPTPEIRPPGATVSRSEIDSLFEDYRAAAARCGQEIQGVTREALKRAVDRQGDVARQQLRCSELDFHIAIDAGRVKIKVSRARE